MKIAVLVLMLVTLGAPMAVAQDLGPEVSPNLAMPVGANVPFGGEIYSLVSVQGQQARYAAQISFAGRRVAGEGPCNMFFADLAYSDSRFEIFNIGSTRRACPDLDAEAGFFDLLGKVTTADRREGQITLFTASGESLYFAAQGQ